MAYLEVYREHLKHNYTVLNEWFSQENKHWGVVTKLLCGNRIYLKELIDLGVREFCDSRVSNLKTIKEMCPEAQTVYIKPPAKRSIKSIVRYADVSFNTEFETIHMLSEESLAQGKQHKIIIMIEMGDLREGVMGDDLLQFYGNVVQLKGVSIVGIGANINCLSGVLPTQDKYIQLSLYKQLIEASFGIKIPYITGGTSITLPLLQRKQIPSSINHFRIGETLFFGTDLLTGGIVEGLRDDIMCLYAEIIEIAEKPMVPIGYLAENPSGEMVDVSEEDYGKITHRAIVDIGLLDISTEFMKPLDEQITILGASSDMVVLDIGNCDKNYKIGDLVSFKLQYMGALGVFNSHYIEKRLK